jgi:hypothetical protein
MKTKIIPILVSLAILYSCEDTTYRQYQGNAPVYISYEELRNAVEVEQGRKLENPGKMYFKDDYIFIIEELKGIHVFDNSDPSSPIKKAFIKIPGIIDMAISGNILYGDSFVDLVVLDLQDLGNIREIGRVRDILPYTLPPTGNELPIAKVDTEKGLVVDWEVTTIREKVYHDDHVIYPFFRMTSEKATFSNAHTGSSGVSSGGIGIGGSMARFGIKEDILYLLDNNTLKLLDITTKSSPVRLFEVNPGWGIETMFLTANNMFLGTTTGMLIYDITNPRQPVRKSTYNHLRSCDPVIVDDTLAYVTLRSGTNCGGAINSLDVVNIKNINAPSLVISYPMTNPHGLGKDGDLLFICDGNAGLKIYNASDPRVISSRLLKTYPDIKTYDVIPLGGLLVMIGDDGLFQYDYSDVNNISLLSTIPVEQE